MISGNSQNPVVVGRNGRIRTCDPLTPSQVNQQGKRNTNNGLRRSKCKTLRASAPVGIAVMGDSAKRDSVNEMAKSSGSRETCSFPYPLQVQPERVPHFLWISTMFAHERLANVPHFLEGL